MNNPNPFLPQGAFLEQKNRAQARLKIAVISSIGLSVLVLMVLLIQGCKKPNDGSEANAGLPPVDTNTSATQLSSNPPPEASNTSNATAPTAAPAPGTNPAPMVNTPPPVAPPVAPPPPPVQEAQEYTIVAHDTYSTIATANHTTVKAIQAANPGVDPRKLKPGQKIKLPAPTSGSSASVAPTAPPMGGENPAAGGTITYKVKSGDTLTTIAKHYHVTIKAIESANSLTTTGIKVGQVLKIPGAATPAPAPAEPAPAPAPAPAPTTATPAPAAH